MTKSRGVGRGGKNKISIDLDKIRTDYLNRKPVEQIARELNVTAQTVYARIKQLGITRPISEACKGRKTWNKGMGERLNWNGYRRTYQDGREVLEHRVVAEQMLGRKLLPSEVVHHINGNRTDNRPENLEVLPSHSDHMKLHMTTDEARRRGRIPKRACLKAKGIEV